VSWREPWQEKKMEKDGKTGKGKGKEIKGERHTGKYQRVRKRERERGGGEAVGNFYLR
jgi:hypothetical protein